MYPGDFRPVPRDHDLSLRTLPYRVPQSVEEACARLVLDYELATSSKLDLKSLLRFLREYPERR